MPDNTEPKNVDMLPVEERAFQLTAQINEMQAKLNEKDVAEQTAEELDEVAKLYKAIEGLYGKEKKGRQMEFKHYSNNRTIEVTDELEKDGLKVGQRFRKKPGEEFDSEEIANAKEFKVVGFRKDESTVVAQIDGGGVGDWRASLFKELFDPIEEQPKERQMVFDDIGGEQITVDEELEKFGLKVGQKIRIKDSKKAAMERNIRDAKELTIAGFDKNDEGCIVIQIDGGQVTYTYYPDLYNDFYETIEEEPKERQMEFFGYGNGERIKVTDTLNMGDYHVGQKLSLKRKTRGGKIDDATTLEVVGFNEDGLVVVQMDGGKVFTDSIIDHGDYFNKSTESNEEQQLEFQTANGGSFLADKNILESDGLKIGQKLMFKDNLLKKLHHANVANAKSLEIVGFGTIKGTAIIQVDGKFVHLIPIQKIKSDFKEKN